MTSIMLRPDAISHLVGFAGSYTDIDESLDALDGNTLQCSRDDNNSTVRIWFPPPGSDLKTGSLKGKIRIAVQNQDSENTQTFDLYAYEGSTNLGIIATQDVGPNGFLNKTIYFDQTVFSGDLSAPDAKIHFTSSQSYIDIYAIEWEAQLDAIALTANNLEAGSPVFGTPVIANAPIEFTALWVAKNPVIGVPVFRQKHSLTATNINISSIGFTTPGASSVSTSNLTVGSPVFGTPSIKSPWGAWESLPTESAQIIEAENLLLRALDALMQSVPNRIKGRNAWDFRRSIGYVRTNKEELIVNGTLGVTLGETVDYARQAGATFESLEAVRRVVVAENPQNLPAKYVAHLFVRMILIQMSLITADTDYASREKATKTLNRISAAYAPAEEDAADEKDPMAYRALVALRAATIRDLAERSRQLPRQVPYHYANSMPSLWIANRIYGDASRADQLKAENNWVHPAFASPDGICLSR